MTNYRITNYTPQYLLTEAKRVVREHGKFAGYSINVHERGTSLVAAYVRRNENNEAIPGTVTIAL